MRLFLMIAALAGALALSLPAGSASAAPVSQPAVLHLDQGAPQQSLIDEVRHRGGYCHWHKSCGYKWRCWWRNGHRHCGTRWTCKRWCHWHRGRIVIRIY